MEFIDFEGTTASNNEVGSEGEVSDVDSMKSFIDDHNKTEIEEDRTFCRNFENVTKPVDETLVEEFSESIRKVETFDEVSNFYESSEEEGEMDELKDVQKRIEKFEEMLHPVTPNDGEEETSSFVYAILFALRFDISEKFEVCTANELQETIGSGLFLKLFENKDKFKLELDNHKFNLQGMEINDILADSSNFLRVYELRKKFGHLSLKNKKTVVRQLSKCIHEKFNSFNIISIEYSKKLGRKFKPINIIYKLVKMPDVEIKCYFL